MGGRWAWRCSFHAARRSGASACERAREAFGRSAPSLSSRASTRPSSPAAPRAGGRARRGSGGPAGRAAARRARARRPPGCRPAGPGPAAADRDPRRPDGPERPSRPRSRRPPGRGGRGSWGKACARGPSLLPPLRARWTAVRGRAERGAGRRAARAAPRRVSAQDGPRRIDRPGPRIGDGLLAPAPAIAPGGDRGSLRIPAATRDASRPALHRSRDADAEPRAARGGEA